MRTHKVSFYGLILFVTAMTLSGCVYTNTTNPLDIDLNKTELGSKVGES
jgi:hypothetical protein